MGHLPASVDLPVRPSLPRKPMHPAIPRASGCVADRLPLAQCETSTPASTHPRRPGERDSPTASRDMEWYVPLPLLTDERMRPAGVLEGRQAVKHPRSAVNIWRPRVSCLPRINLHHQTKQN